MWQYNNLVTLFDNWDVFKQNLSYAQNSAGTLQEQAEIYEESWTAASNRVKASLEDVYSTILDDDAFKTLLNTLASGIKLVDLFVDSIGGLPGVLALVGAMSTKVFKEQMANSLNNLGGIISFYTGISKDKNAEFRSNFILLALEAAKNTDLNTEKVRALIEQIDSKLKLQLYISKNSEKITEQELETLEVFAEYADKSSQKYVEAADNFNNTYNKVYQTINDVLRLADTKTDGGQALLDLLYGVNLEKDSMSTAIMSLRDLNGELNEDSLNNVESYKKEVSSLLDTLKESSNIPVKNIEEAFSIINNVESKNNIKEANLNIGELFKNISDLPAFSQEYYQLFYDELDYIQNKFKDNFDKETNQKINDLKKIIQDENTGFIKIIEDRDNAYKDFIDSSEYVLKLAEAFGESPKSNRIADSMVALGNTISNTTIAVLSLQSAWETLNNEDASGFEKIISVAMSLGVTLPAIIELMGTLKTIRLANIKETIKSTAATTLHTLANKADTKSEKDKTAAVELNTVALSENNAAQAAETLTLNMKTVKNIFSALIPVIKKVTIGLGAFALITTGFNFAQEIYELSKRDWGAYNINQASEAITNLTQSYNDLNTELLNFNTSVETYENVRNELSQLTEGTEEYKEKLKEANDAALSLIQNYDDLEGDDWYIEDGEIIISPESIDALDQAMEIDLLNIQSANLLATQNKNELNTLYSAQEQAMNFAKENSSWGQELPLFKAYQQLVNDYAKNPKIFDSVDSLRKYLEENGLSQIAANNELVTALYEAETDITELSGTIQKNTESRENIYQQNANSQLDALGLDLEVYGKIGARVYENLINSKTAEINKNFEQEYAQYLMDYYHLDSTLANTAKYDKFNQTVTYTDEEGNKLILTEKEIEATAAAIKANEEFLRSMLDLSKNMYNLSKSADTADKSLLQFLQNGNLEGLTKAEYDKISNLIDYNLKAGSYDSKQLNSILGLTGTKEENEEKAAEYGYDSAEAFREAFVEGLDVNWELPDGLKDEINNFLTLGTTETIRDNFKTLGDKAGQNYIAGLNLIYDSIDWSQFSSKEASLIWDNIINYDWQSSSIQDLQKALNEIGAEIDYSSESWLKFANAALSAFKYTVPNIETLYEDFKQIHEVIDEISVGDILSDEDYLRLVKYNNELEKYFITLADGSYQMIGDPLDLLQDTRATEMDEYENSIRQYQGAIEDFYQKQDLITYINTIDSSMKNLNETVKNGTENWKQLVSQLLNILQSDKYDQEELSEWRAKLGRNELSNDDLTKISSGVKDTENSMNLSMETIYEYNELMKLAMNTLAMMSNTEEAELYYKEGIIDTDSYVRSSEYRINQDKYENIEAEEVLKYSDYLLDAANSSSELSKELIDNAEAAEDVAVTTQRMNVGAEKLIDNWDTWGDILKNSSKESQEYAEASEGVKEALSDLLQVNEAFISDDFIALHLNEIESAAMGDINAIDSLRSAMAQDIIMNVTLNNTGVREEAFGLLTDVQNMLNSQDIQIGATIDDAGIINKINEILRITGMSVEEAQSMLNSLGFEPTFLAKKLWLHEWTPVYETTMQITGVENNSGSPLPDTFKYKQTTLLVGKTYHSWQTEVPAWSADGTPLVTSLTATGGGSMSGGFSGFNYSPSNAGGAAAYTPSSSSGGGGGSEADEPTPSEQMEYTQITEILDRYYEITDSIDDMTDALDDASDAADRLYGKDRIAAMEKLRDLLAQQKILLEQYRAEIETYLAKDKAALENNQYGIHFTFDTDGDITNYTLIMTDLYNLLHAAEQTYNSFATKEELDAYLESTLDPLNKKIEEIKDLISTYTNTTDLLVDVDNLIQDSLNEWQDQNYEILTYKVELLIEINDMEQDKLDYYLNKYEDDFYKMAESLALVGDSFPLLTNNLETYKDEVNKLTNAYNNGEISLADFIEGMKDVNSAILENMNNLVDLDREMLEYYENTLDKAEDKLEDFTDLLDHQLSILEHYQNVLSLIGKEQDYLMIGSVLLGLFKTALDLLSAQEKWVETLKEQKADIETDLANAVGEEENKALQEQLLLVTQRLNEAEESVNSLRESVLELANAILENDLAEYSLKLSEGLVGSLGFSDIDEYLDKIDRLNTLLDEYLTTTNKIYETDKLIKQAKEDMAENDSLLAKQKYLEYIDYIELLQELGKLSEYELEIAQARYEVLQAQIALEEAQNAKDTMRLVRDSLGNYNYVYTANLDNISLAQQALEDAENNLYNIGLQGAQDYQDKYAQTLQDAFEAFKNLSEEYKSGLIASEEEYNLKLLSLLNHYYELLKNYQDLYYKGHGLMVEESYNNEADYLFAGIGSLEDFKDATNQYLEDCNQAFDKWQENTEVATDSIGNGMGDLLDKVDEVTDSSDELTNLIQDSLIPALEDELEAVRDVTNLWLSHRDALYETLQAYEELQQGVQNTVSSAAGVLPGGILPDIPEEYQQDYAAIMAAYLLHGGSVDDELFNTLLQQRNEKIEWLAAHGYSSDYYGTYGEATKDYYEELLAGGGDLNWYNYAANMYSMKEIRLILEKLGLPTFKTGGYTGNWGPEGRLAIIHEKELILNLNDTNSLMNIIRDYGNLQSLNLNNNILSSIFYTIVSDFKNVLSNFSFDNNKIAAQQVSILAEFPNVSVADEIENAFNDLLNQAALYVSLNRKN